MLDDCDIACDDAPLLLWANWDIWAPEGLTVVIIDREFDTLVDCVRTLPPEDCVCEEGSLVLPLLTGDVWAREDTGEVASRRELEDTKLTVFEGVPLIL